MGVDAALGTRVGGHALVDVHARLPVALQLESRMTPALKAARAKGGEEKQNKKRHNLTAGRAISRYSPLRVFDLFKKPPRNSSRFGVVCLFVCKFQPGKPVKCRRGAERTAASGLTFAKRACHANVRAQTRLSYLKTAEFTQSSGCFWCSSDLIKEPKHELRNRMPQMSAFQLPLHRSSMTNG